MNATDHVGVNCGHNVIALRFALGQWVNIKMIETKGMVMAFTLDTDGRSYKVVYFDDDKVRRVEWMLEAELS